MDQSTRFLESCQQGDVNIRLVAYPDPAGTQTLHDCHGSCHLHVRRHDAHCSQYER